MSMGQLPQICPCGYLQLGKHAHGAGSWKLCVCVVHAQLENH